MQNIIEIKQLSREEKLKVMEAIWKDLSDEEEKIESPDWHKKALEETELRLSSGQDKDHGLARCQITFITAVLGAVMVGWGTTLHGAGWATCAAAKEFLSRRPTAEMEPVILGEQVF